MSLQVALAGKGVTDAGAGALAVLVASSSVLRSLDLADNPLTVHGAFAIAHALSTNAASPLHSVTLDARPLPVKASAPPAPQA